MDPSPDPPPGESTAFAAPECLACGACCFSSAAQYVRVTGADWSRLGAEADRWAVFDNHRAYLRMVDGHCAALQLEPADPSIDQPARFVCAIYDQRPQTCRDLGRGSPACEAEWLRKRADARRAVGE
ncbi:YkgJ family cysteine cluster protein [Actomonas aquatica]|uniref:YkgJ family cysteine cluster protein n=1 Tax=Actomonas aquatica TaxID=2866162 RepID=A0ABZ1C401_9BACT|nr:YkgJ family cysteine cluster protein [Opitutus sp. WL0086]WRQ86077.1 YkgJ family cysteine cluster protein [Opitutus sp. WL0086]